MFYTPLTYDVGDIIETYVYRMGLERSDYSFSTAAGLFNSVVSLILVLITNKIAHKCGQQGIW